MELSLIRRMKNAFAYIIRVELLTGMVTVAFFPRHRQQ